jgi:hypothetical protein
VSKIEPKEIQLIQKEQKEFKNEKFSPAYHGRQRALENFAGTRQQSGKVTAPHRQKSTKIAREHIARRVPETVQRSDERQRIWKHVLHQSCPGMQSAIATRDTPTAAIEESLRTQTHPVSECMYWYDLNSKAAYFG